MDKARKDIARSWLRTTAKPALEKCYKPYFDLIETDIGLKRNDGPKDDINNNEQAQEFFKLASTAIELIKAELTPKIVTQEQRHKIIPITQDQSIPLQVLGQQVPFNIQVQITSSAAQGQENTTNTECETHSVTRDKIQTNLTGKCKKPNNDDFDTAELEGAIHRAIRFLFMINSRRPQDLLRPSPSKTEWRAGKSLLQFIHDTFYPKGSIRQKDDSEIASIQARLTHQLTAVNIEKFTDIEIVPTNWLPDHLRLEYGEENKILYVFLNIRWLLDARDQVHFPIPAQILEEAIMSLNYLFPRGEEATKYFQDKHSHLYEWNPEQLSGDRPRLRDFIYYNNRLVDVALEYLNPPQDWTLSWKDKRNPMQFWTFWLGLLIFFFTVVFGIMATVLAGLQLGAALHPPNNT